MMQLSLIRPILIDVQIDFYNFREALCNAGFDTRYTNRLYLFILLDVHQLLFCQYVHLVFSNKSCNLTSIISAAFYDL